LNWISSTSFEKTHEDIYAKKHPDTGEWLVRMPQFQAWLDGTASGLLWCYGKREFYGPALSISLLRYYSWHWQIGACVRCSFMIYFH
jgi:hypothetical protein